MIKGYFSEPCGVKRLEWFEETEDQCDRKGAISSTVTAAYNGSGLYHSVASDPELVVSNLSLPPQVKANLIFSGLHPAINILLVAGQLIY